jgi:multisubunit Na+/H+ antiporter MnhB subunit
VAAIGVTLAGALGAVLFRNVGAIMSLGISGLGVASLMALEPAPDVALVQILADILMLVLLLAALPKLRRTSLPVSRTVPALLGIGWGLAGAALSAWALSGRPRLSGIEPYVSAQSKILAGASDIVGALVVEFRGFDTLVEITVFAFAGLAAWSLIDKRDPVVRETPSPLLVAVAGIIPPLTLMFAFIQILFGHDRPGDGFTAGVTVALGLAIIDGVHGAGEAERRFRWLKPDRLVALGIFLVLLRLGWPLWSGGAPLAPFVLWSGGPKGLALSGGLFFEIGIFLAVLGGAARMLRTQGTQ